MLEIIGSIKIKNIDLGGGKHSIKGTDFAKMIKELSTNFCTNRGGKIPCLLFYSNEDEYVGPSFAKELKGVRLIIEDENKEKAVKELFKEIDDEVESEVVVKLEQNGIDKNAFYSNICEKRDSKKCVMSSEKNTGKTTGSESNKKNKCCKSCK